MGEEDAQHPEGASQRPTGNIGVLHLPAPSGPGGPPPPEEEEGLAIARRHHGPGAMVAREASERAFTAGRYMSLATAPGRKKLPGVTARAT